MCAERARITRVISRIRLSRVSLSLSLCVCVHRADVPRDCARSASRGVLAGVNPLRLHAQDSAAEISMPFVRPFDRAVRHSRVDTFGTWENYRCIAVGVNMPNEMYTERFRLKFR